MMIDEERNYGNIILNHACRFHLDLRNTLPCVLSESLSCFISLRKLKALCNLTQLNLSFGEFKFEGNAFGAHLQSTLAESRKRERTTFIGFATSRKP